MRLLISLIFSWMITARRSFHRGAFLLLTGHMFFYYAGAQVVVPACATDQVLKLARNDPEYMDREKKMNSLIRERVLQKSQSRSAKDVSGLRNRPSAPQAMVYTLPIVFHIVSSMADSISDAQVYATLAELNDAFAHRNAYGNDTNGVDTYIQFCMARTTPDGGLTNGIDRVNTYYENHDVDLEGGVPQSLISWDPSRYVNVWVVSSIQSELQPSGFKCGGWKRMGIAGYASVGGGWGAIVSGLGVPLLAHELGHYLSLLHTFTGMDCANNDCSLDGDLVCDTPPDKSTESSPCSDPENSCNTDTLSGPFTKDAKDNISNFMDYGSPCPTVFTQGQADRMRSFVELYNGGILINSILCNTPCGDTTDARFNWNTNPHPVIGDTVTFTNNSTGALKYKWYVNDVLVDSIEHLRYGFTEAGKYKVTLIAYAEDSLCFASYTGNVIVNCGVVARFSPTERIIASKKDMYSDPVRFWNKSWGANEYEWYVQDPYTGIDSMVSTDVDLVYDFPEPGAYRIRLVARNGTCVSNSPVYTMVVEDPTPDGLLNIKRVDCYKNDSLRIVFSVINTGFDTIPANLSVTFYDRPSHLPGAQKMTSTFYTDRIVIGRCEVEFVHIVKTITNRQDYVFGIIDEEKAVFEKSDLNNTSERTNFQIRLSLEPPLQLVYVHTDTSVRLRYAPDWPAKITWTSDAAIIYDSIQKVGLRVTDTTLVKVNTESVYACTDSAFANIHVYPIDIRIKTKEIYCYKNDSLLVVEQVCIGNRYKNLKRDIQTLYYDNAPNSAGAVLLGRSLLEKETVFTDSCVLRTRLIKMTGTGKVYSKINMPMTQYEDSLSNNTSDINYIPFRIRFVRPKIEIYRNEPYRLSVLNDGERYKSLLWTPSNRLSCSACPDPVITTTNNELLKVVGRTQYDCTDSAFLDIKTFSRRLVSLPNVFTPNGDGLNDYFYVIASQKVVRVKQFQVFNRWGEKMFEAANTSANDNKSGWDGTYKGNKVPMGSYVYVVVVELDTGESETFKGTISILR